MAQMGVLLFPCNQTSSPSPSLTCFFKSISANPKRTLTFAKTPARDRIIDFGKYRGKMLGTLPSKYLTWVSKNLRARDFEEWARLADEVLQDPVYKDRLEWESAERILSGDDSRAFRTQTPVSDLAEIAERFGWDSENKAAWRRVDFGLLGTSKGGRIPRIGGSDTGKVAIQGECGLGFSKKDRGVPKMGKFDSLEKDSGLRVERRLGFLQKKSGVSEIEEMGSLESKRERKPGSLNRDSGVSRIGAVTSANEESRFKSSRNLGSLDEEEGTFEGTFRGKESQAFEAKKADSFGGRKVGFLSTGSRYYDTKEQDFEEEMVGGRREERRERLRLKRSLQMQRLKCKVGVKVDRFDSSEIQKQAQRKGSFNPFPGREALLRKVSKQQD